ncbi:hypothetical protein PPERSA_09981 [Pseudocohnilembus persalinus]|uniref:Uncharacterized protein n=1 Tax=Pseudocohnilembus persalinus TaxID=266149 RepID=A0A0V0QJV8_PSEPJ|nr:hypothetical protein PPERSA_09981 [Pseudocohnilembus persalinus]|eukprot:KRX02364.1 hypothetical protein PPERSA_09981 [Pseudocohnilembus persalinus]
MSDSSDNDENQVQTQEEIQKQLDKRAEMAKKLNLDESSSSEEEDQEKEKQQQNSDQQQKDSDDSEAENKSIKEKGSELQNKEQNLDQQDTNNQTNKSTEEQNKELNKKSSEEQKSNSGNKIQQQEQEQNNQQIPEKNEEKQFNDADSNNSDKEDENRPSEIKKQRNSQALQYQIDAKSCNAIRKESYQILKNQDDKMQDYFNNHKQVVDAALNRLERRVKISTEGMKNIIIYFQNKSQFEQNYMKTHLQKLPKLGMQFKDTSDSQTVMYPGLSKAFQQCDDMNDQQMKIIQVFINYIDKNIVKDLLLYEQSEFEKKANISMEAIKKAKQKLASAQKQYQTQSQKYYKNYHDLTVTEEKAKKRDKDFYNTETKFKKSAIDYMRSSRQYGTQVWKLWQQQKKLEKNRLDLIQRAFQMYLEKYESTYGVLPMMKQQNDTWKEFKHEQEAADNFDLERILNSEDLQTLKKGLLKDSEEKISIEDVEYFMTKYQCQELEKYSKLVLQTFQGQRDVGAVKKEFKQCELIVTIDDFLLFFDEPVDTEITVATKKLHMNKVSAKKIKDKTQELYVVEKVPGVLINSTNKIKVKFDDQEQMEEFVGYVQKFNKVGMVEN